MAIGTISIAALPGYAVLGLAAPLLVLVGRLVQGFSAGVELGGVAVYLSEIAPPALRGFFVSWQSGSQQVAVIFAAVVGALLTAHLSPCGDGRVRVAHPIHHRVRDPTALVLAARIAERNGGVRRAHRATHARAIGRIARAQLAHRRARRDARDDDDRVVLFHHRVHADVRHGRAPSTRSSRRCS